MDSNEVIHRLRDIALFLSHHLEDMLTPQSNVRFREAVNSTIQAKAQLSQALRLNCEPRNERLIEAGRAYLARPRERYKAPASIFDPTGQIVGASLRKAGASERPGPGGG